MRRWTWGLLVLSVASLALFFALFSPWGSGTPRSSALVNTGHAHIEIDVVQDPGGTWCNPVDTTTNVVSGVHKAAICLTDVTTVSPGAFNIELNYDIADNLNSCTDTPNQTIPALDSNPDANVGTTVFSGNTGAGNLGTGCDCSSGGLAFPTCDYWAGFPPDDFTATERTAYVSCACATSATLPIGAAVSSVLAVVTYTANGTGVDSLEFGTVAVYPGPILRCPSAYCFGATVIKGNVPTNTPLPPTATPTTTNTPLPTATPTITQTPTITNTPLPATSTPTATATSTPTNTPQPSPTPTYTPTPTVFAFIDKNVGNDCNFSTRTSHTTETVGDTHSMAVCLANIPDELEAFTAVVTFDSDLDQCPVTGATCDVETDPDCLDANPDANAGDTTFGTSLGPDWDCNWERGPTCNDTLPTSAEAASLDSAVGEAIIYCERHQVADGVFGASPFTDHLTLATLTLKVAAAGEDTVGLDLAVQGIGFSASCRQDMTADLNADSVAPTTMDCFGATDTKESVIRHRRTATPTEKPTATETAAPPATSTPIPPPPPTATPLGGVGTQIVPPPTGSGSSGGSFPWALAFVGAAGTAALAGGLSLRLGWVRRRAR
jgi:hypothetical protein